MREHHSYWFAGTALIACLTVTPALAKDEGPSPYAPCAEIADDSERLACFDATYAREGELLAQRAAAARQESVENFGLSDFQIREREEAERGPDAVTELDEEGQIAATVVGVFANDRSGKRIFTLDNGQIWAEAQVSRMKRNPREGQSVTISKASLGRYQLRVDGRSGVVDVTRMR
ncbi:hypothetical protein INR77_05285 [Erythrobacter sp. SCSIO 43205]|uniref:hypothetical protein n=1 Tax=Erythrobacter sp. SCSIO 43205 TaxID=2779361 RepID=UPI001CA8E17E|nr:hypothetical protein [Erythrobacter sp. SCSIO 43205]UAB79104.1 hypothetical protein INR77_05285 [Erythrobacter sp. SCSIO 43205]